MTSELEKRILNIEERIRKGQGSNEEILAEMEAIKKEQERMKLFFPVSEKYNTAEELLKNLPEPTIPEPKDLIKFEEQFKEYLEPKDKKFELTENITIPKQKYIISTPILAYGKTIHFQPGTQLFINLSKNYTNIFETYQSSLQFQGTKENPVIITATGLSFSGLKISDEGELLAEHTLFARGNRTLFAEGNSKLKINKCTFLENNKSLISVHSLAEITENAFINNKLVEGKDIIYWSYSENKYYTIEKNYFSGANKQIVALDFVYPLNDHRRFDNRSIMRNLQDANWFGNNATITANHDHEKTRY